MKPLPRVNKWESVNGSLALGNVYLRVQYKFNFLHRWFGADISYLLGSRINQYRHSIYGWPLDIVTRPGLQESKVVSVGKSAKREDPSLPVFWEI
jgi:hypothetical protein